MALFFLSDNHFAHDNVRFFSNRPFSSIEEMNSTMVTRWNEQVQSNDTVYHLGDFAMGPRTNIPHFLSQLNGRKILIRGNHDRSAKFMLDSGFAEVHESLWIKEEGRAIYMRHRPHWSWRQDHKGVQKDSIHLCGHCHELFDRTSDDKMVSDPQGDIINVGVDQSEFYPLTLAELLVRKMPERHRVSSLARLAQQKEPDETPKSIL